MDDRVTILLKKLDQLAIFLNIKFFQNITLTYYKTFDEMFGKMANLENEMSDVSHRMKNNANSKDTNLETNFNYDDLRDFRD